MLIIVIVTVIVIIVFIIIINNNIINIINFEDKLMLFHIQHIRQKGWCFC